MAIWKCPNCWTPVSRLPTEWSPQIGKVYRCPICRLDLMFDVQEGKRLELAPIRTDTPQDDKSA
jgi:DNA-directed RNA polymerase subunit RPC12/RpoP